MSVRLLADDLTGALDASVRLVARAGELPVTWDAAAALTTDGPLALVTPTRDGPAEKAVAAIAALKNFWRADTLAFKKIDSLWRGNTLPEMIALIESGVFATVIVAHRLSPSRTASRARDGNTGVAQRAKNGN